MYFLVRKEFNIVFFRDTKHFLAACDENLSKTCFLNVGIERKGNPPKIGYFKGFNQERDIIFGF